MCANVKGQDLLKGHDMTWRAVRWQVHCRELQVFGEFIPPFAQISGLFLDAVEELGLGALTHRIIDMDQDLVQDLG